MPIIPRAKYFLIFSKRSIHIKDSKWEKLPTLLFKWRFKLGYPDFVWHPSSLFLKKIRQFLVTGRRIPTEKHPQPEIISMRLFARDETLAKSKFWYTINYPSSTPLLTKLPWFFLKVPSFKTKQAQESQRRDRLSQRGNHSSPWTSLCVFCAWILFICPLDPKF